MADNKVSESVKLSMMETVRQFLEESGEEVLLVKSGTFSVPWAKDEKEGYLNITFSIPRGARDGDGYNGHEDAQNFAFEQKVKETEKVRKQEEKAKKIVRDAALRARKKADAEAAEAAKTD